MYFIYLFLLCFLYVFLVFLKCHLYFFSAHFLQFLYTNLFSNSSKCCHCICAHCLSLLFIVIIIFVVVVVVAESVACTHAVQRLKCFASDATDFICEYFFIYKSSKLTTLLCADADADADTDADDDDARQLY